MISPAFRYAVQADAPALVALIERAYRGPETAGTWISEAHLLKGPRTSDAEVSALIARPDSRFLIAEDNGLLIGCALLQQTGGNLVTHAPKDEKPYFGAFATPRKGAPARAAPIAPTESSAYFGMFAVNPSVHSSGLGKVILAEAERRARELWNAKSMVMTVINLRSELIGYYERRGFARTGVTLAFPFTPASGETTRDFHLVEMKKQL